MRFFEWCSNAALAEIDINQRFPREALINWIFSSEQGRVPRGKSLISLFVTTTANIPLGAKTTVRQAHKLSIKFVMLILLTLLSGCVGIAIESTLVIESDVPLIGKSKGKVFLPQQPVEAYKNYSSRDLSTHWGEPDEIETPGEDTEIWHYRTGIKWKGIYIAIIVPIPLMIPAGSDIISFYIDKQGAIYKARIIYNDTTYTALCGFVVGHFSFGCEAKEIEPVLDSSFYPEEGYL